MSNPIKVLKDYYFPVRVEGLQKNVYVTIAEPFTNGVPSDAYVIKVSSPPNAQFGVVCCLHTASGWLHVEVEKGSHTTKKLRKSRDPTSPTEVIFSLMLRILGSSGTSYSGHKRPSFPLVFELFQMIEGTARVVDRYEVEVEAATKIPKRELVIHLSTELQVDNRAEEAVLLSPIAEEVNQPNPSPQPLMLPLMPQPQAGLTQDWMQDILMSDSYDHYDDVGDTPLDFPTPDADFAGAVRKRKAMGQDIDINDYLV